MSDYYEILGIARNATTKQVKAAYRDLAVKYHPDKNPDADAAKKFKEVTQAYENLFDTNKRAYYDRICPPKSAKPKQTRTSKKPPTAEELRAMDPNLGKIWDAPPPKFDLWGKPLSKEDQASWNGPAIDPYQNHSKPKPKPKPKPKVIGPSEKFIDTYERYYFKDEPPSLRG